MKKKRVYSNESINKNLQDMSSKNIDTILRELNSSIDGLSEIEADNRLSFYGHNEIISEKRKPWYIYLLNSFVDPFILILLVIVLVSYFTDIAFAPPGEKSWMTIVIISTMILISVILKFSQEYKSQITADNLKYLVPTTTSVKRGGMKKREINISDVVPGDIIHLAAGDLIPADLRIITCKDLFISQSSLTGESEPVEKFSEIKDKNVNKNISDLENIALMGTIVVSGSAVGIVLQTGNQTYFGTIAESLAKDRGQTSFEEGVKSVSFLLIRFMLVMVPIVFLINGLTKKDWINAFLFAISIAVGLTPEMLPTLVSTNLAKGAISLSKRKIVVKRLSSIQNFGAMDILCTDKTGTLTLDKIILETHLDVLGNENDRVLRHGYLNSYYQTGLKNLLDIAVIEYGNEKGFNEVTKIYERVDEIPFDFTRRRMSVVVESENGKRQLITKGAVEEMISICSFVEINGDVLPLTEDLIKTVMDMVTKLNEDGMRVLAIAQKNNVPDENIFSIKDESNMVLIGYMGFLDPPKDSAVSAIKALHEHGVTVKVLTGDNDIVAKKICKDVGIPVDTVVLGIDVEEMIDEKLYEVASKSNILAKLSPMQKERVISVLQNNNHVVGFLGDGINDAQALKQADVGISVDTAVDIAKESADIILLEKDLNVLEKGVIEGRRVFGNIVKYINMTASSNFGNVFSVLAASAFLPFLPMLPIQLLVQNLLYSISQIAIPWDSMDEEYLKTPQKWNADKIGKFMLYIGPISSIFDIATFAIMWFVFKANTIELQPLFQSGWFVVGLVSQTLIVHMIRTKKIPFIQSRASTPLMIMTFLIISLGIIIPYTGFGTYIGLVPLPFSYFPWLVGILLAYSILTQIVKNIYIKKFNTWM
ncbi:magnesium-translocating P-type ATPase [Tissierella sp. MB52-C2]|uniref:magnesium-translocating P-type ATPase n=1 Tax=Tissierella sp. MB52-C2 TaxID=3070999 RepID=UPI00280C2684|nr:magnesium-translocating P-type ATPase [Tissierella sp. MB52-C2]WMM24707.1 magnesium-translocating P-type ATPase [Tissierella sp. MB52-C2]